jgi:hypothetical protein
MKRGEKEEKNTEKKVLKILPYFIKYSAHFFYIENNAKIFSAHHTRKVDENGLKMAFMMNKLAMINSREIIIEKQNIFLPKIIVKFRCALYLYAHYTQSFFNFLSFSPVTGIQSPDP